MRDDKGKKHVNSVFLFIICKERTSHMGITKEYKKHASLQPNKIAIKENDRVLTYKEWFESVCKVANWLHATESKNKTIAILLENRIEFYNYSLVPLWPGGFVFR